MKFVVPLTMPRTRSTRFAARSRRERAEDRDPATDRRLEAERRAGAPGDRLELRPVVGDDVLVGRDDALAHRQRRGDQRVGRLVAAHQLDDDVDPLVRHEMGRRVGEQARRARPAATARSTSRTAMATSSSAAPSDGTQVVGPVEQRADHLAPDRPGTEHADAQPGAAHDWSRAGRDIGRMVADPSERPPRVSARRLHSRAMTTELAPAPAPLAAPAARAADLLGHPAVRRRPPRQRPGRRSGTTSGSRRSTRRSTASSTTTR